MPRKKILLIDDEKEFINMMKMHLQALTDFKVDIATSGKAGLALARKEKPDLIVLDVLMPDMPGNEVAHVLSCDEETRNIPIVFLTAMVREGEMSRGGLIGGHPFVAKPADVEKLVTVIDKYIG